MALSFNEVLARQAPKLLTDLTVYEVSLVERGANPGARVLFWKSDDDPNSEETTTMEQLSAIEKNTLSLCALVDASDSEEDLQILDRATFEQGLDDYANTKAKPGETSAATHARLYAADPIYKKLAFGARYAKPNFIDVPQPQATVKTSSAEQGLEALARTKAADENIPFAKAYVAVLETPEGRRLYAESRQTKAAAGADPTK